ncbi:50S ribosomal protein L29 [Candidatus Falkowbacteria bacterium]|jgi:ribosomal protein L29|nr:50S ribosomal protein L29 [Candidatus Falkowbacteria bacterium]MBT7007142.1 50S ribosomal protein L29 [Candidatus Falkowbacteria bacterium]MBT7402609.1 50S ribosomal protein L29 [Candidatus Woesearchaeota archaeon]
MKNKELKGKSTEELQKLYNQYCSKTQELNFKIANKQVKNIREVRENKKTIARILTLLNQKKAK